MTESEFQRRAGNGSMMLHKTDRRGNTSLGTLEPFGSRIWVDDWTIEHSVSNTEFPLAVKPDGSVGVPTNPKGEPEGPVPTVTIGANNDGYFITVAHRVGFGTQPVQAPSNPQAPPRRLSNDELTLLSEEIKKALKSETCKTFIDKLISYNTGKPYSTADHFLMSLAHDMSGLISK